MLQPISLTTVIPRFLFATASSEHATLAIYTVLTGKRYTYYPAPRKTGHLATDQERNRINKMDRMVVLVQLSRTVETGSEGSGAM